MRNRALFAILPALLLFPRASVAGVFFGAEFDAAKGFAMPEGTHLGFAFLGTLGYRIGVGPVFVQPEAQGGYAFFPGPTIPPHASRIVGGGSFGLRGRFEPSLFAHTGAGFLVGGLPGPTFDAGAALSVR